MKDANRHDGKPNAENVNAANWKVSEENWNVRNGNVNAVKPNKENAIAANWKDAKLKDAKEKDATGNVNSLIAENVSAETGNAMNMNAETLKDAKESA